MTDDDAFRFLGLKPGASPTRVEAAYKERVWEAHPDRGGNAEVFARLGEARRVASRAALDWPCDICHGRRKVYASNHKGGAFGSVGVDLVCGGCGGSGKKW